MPNAFARALSAQIFMHWSITPHLIREEGERILFAAAATAAASEVKVTTRSLA
jgi:hypothetical protein